MRGQQLLGQAGILAPKDEIRAVGVGHIHMAARAFGCKIKKRAFVFGKKIRQILIICYIKLVPVVKPGAFQFFVVHGKAHRAYHVQPCARHRAGPCNVAGILRDLRLDQYNV